MPKFSTKKKRGTPYNKPQQAVYHPTSYHESISHIRLNAMKPNGNSRKPQPYKNRTHGRRSNLPEHEPKKGGRRTRRSKRTRKHRKN